MAKATTLRAQTQKDADDKLARVVLLLDRVVVLLNRVRRLELADVGADLGLNCLCDGQKIVSGLGGKPAHFL